MKKEQQKVGIVIIHFGKPAFTKECCNSLSKLNYKNFEVFIINNDKRINIKKYIHEERYKIKFVDPQKNIGFGAANNIGIKKALTNDCQFVMLLNNDTIVHPELVNELLKAIRSDSKIGIVGGEIFCFDDPEKIWFRAGKYDLRTGCAWHEVEKERKDDENGEYIVDYITGCLMFFNVRIFNDVGFFNPIYFLYCEDSDLSSRIQKLGYKQKICEKAKIWHRTNNNQNSIYFDYFNTRNMPLVIFLNHREWFKDFLPNYTQRLIERINILNLNGDYKRAKILWMGFVDFLLGRFGRGRIDKIIDNENSNCSFKLIDSILLELVSKKKMKIVNIFSKFTPLLLKRKNSVK